MTHDKVKMIELHNLPVTIEGAELWLAAEWLVSTDPTLREQGFALLTQHELARFSPLVCHLLLSLLDDPDLTIRAASIHVLAGVYARNNQQYIAPVETRQFVSEQLSRFTVARIRHMLQALDADALGDAHAHPEALARLLDRIPAASSHLEDIVANRRLPPADRLAAARMIGEIGLADALAPLKNVRNRMRGRRAGRRPLQFTPSRDPATAELLQAVEDTISLLESGG
ncbi:MAG: hypothetical protein ACE5FI_14720 [Anaerolineales bacterium]